MKLVLLIRLGFAVVVASSRIDKKGADTVCCQVTNGSFRDPEITFSEIGWGFDKSRIDRQLQDRTSMPTRHEPTRYHWQKTGERWRDLYGVVYAYGVVYPPYLLCRQPAPWLPWGRKCKSKNHKDLSIEVKDLTSSITACTDDVGPCENLGNIWTNEYKERSGISQCGLTSISGKCDMGGWALNENYNTHVKRLGISTSELLAYMEQYSKYKLTVAKFAPGYEVDVARFELEMWPQKQFHDRKDASRVLEVLARENYYKPSDEEYLYLRAFRYDSTLTWKHHDNIDNRNLGDLGWVVNGAAYLPDSDYLSVYTVKVRKLDVYPRYMNCNQGQCEDLRFYGETDDNKTTHGNVFGLGSCDQREFDGRSLCRYSFAKLADGVPDLDGALEPTRQATDWSVTGYLGTIDCPVHGCKKWGQEEKMNTNAGLDNLWRRINRALMITEGVIAKPTKRN